MFLTCSHFSGLHQQAKFYKRNAFRLQLTPALGCLSSGEVERKAFVLAAQTMSSRETSKRPTPISSQPSSRPPSAERSGASTPSTPTTSVPTITTEKGPDDTSKLRTFLSILKRYGSLSFFEYACYVTGNLRACGSSGKERQGAVLMACSADSSASPILPPYVSLYQHNFSNPSQI